MGLVPSGNPRESGLSDLCSAIPDAFLTLAGSFVLSGTHGVQVSSYDSSHDKIEKNILSSYQKKIVMGLIKYNKCKIELKCA